MALGSLRVLCNYKSNANWQWQRQLATLAWRPKGTSKANGLFRANTLAQKRSECASLHTHVRTHAQTERGRVREREMTTCWPLDSLKSLSRFYFRFRFSSFFLHILHRAGFPVCVEKRFNCSFSFHLSFRQKRAPEVLMKAAGRRPPTLSTTFYRVTQTLPCSNL